MPRPKGSKNKVKTAIPTTTDFAALIAEKAAAKESLTADITALEENLETIKADLKAKKAELKKLDTELSKLEEQKAEADAKAAEEAANSHFLRTAGPHSPDSPGHIKRTVLEISRAERGFRPANQYRALSQKAMPSQSVR